MAQDDFPLRMFTPNYEPIPEASICYYSGKRDLIDALRIALTPGEWEELSNSNFGIFLRFHELRFKWCSRLVHHMLSSQLVCEKRHEIWSLISVQPVRFSLHEFEHITGLNCGYVDNVESPVVQITEEMRCFWELLGVVWEEGPSYMQLLEACGRCDSWERQERIWLGYLAIYVSFIEAQPYTTASRAAVARFLLVPGALETFPWGRLAFKFLVDSVKLANVQLSQNKAYKIEGFAEVLNIWIYWAMPEMARRYGRPVPNDPTPPLLAYRGSWFRRNVKTTLQTQTNVNNFIVKDFGDMFPMWANDSDDDNRVVNIVRAMFGHFGMMPWRWSTTHWKQEGVYRAVNGEGGSNLPAVAEYVFGA